MSPGLQTLKINIDKAKAKMPEAIRQAYCIVVTVSDKDDVQAFKISVADEAHFETIKKDPRSRVKDTAITADALLPNGPYNLWKGGETSRRVKDLAGAFAQLPHLPKMLKSQAIVETLVEGCVQGTFVLKLTRPDRTFRTWWRTRAGRRGAGRSGAGIGPARGGRTGRHSRRTARPEGPAQPLDRRADHRPGRAGLLQRHDRGAGGQGRFPGARAGAQGVGRRGQRRDRRGRRGGQGMAAVRALPACWPSRSLPACWPRRRRCASRRR